MFRNTMFGLVLSLAFTIQGFAQAELGITAAENYRTDASVGLPDYFVLGKIVVQTDADANSPTESVCPFRVFRGDGMELQGFYADRASLTEGEDGDLVLDPSNDTVFYPFVKFGHETVKSDSSVWSSSKPVIEAPLSKTDYEVGPVYGSPHLIGTLQRSHDWPMAWMWCVRSVKPGEIPLAADYPLERMKCVEAKEAPGGAIVAKWVKTRKEPKHNLEIDEVREIEYRNDLVVKCKSYYAAFTSDRKTLKNTYQEDFVKTEWGDKGGENVPLHVEWVSAVKNDGINFLTYDIRFQWFVPGDEEYEEFKASLRKRVEELKKIPTRGVPPGSKK